MNTEIGVRLSQVESFHLAMNIIEKLVHAGHTAYFAGGCIRDAMLGIKPKDIDIATTAKPEDVEYLFPHTVAVGKKFGIIVVVENKLNIEVATFRKESDYRDGRRPENIEYSGPKEDSVRRDFTVNALFYDPIKNEVIDFQDGVSDIQRKKIRCVGDPNRRFSEDYLRILRCFRFALVLDFEIDTATLASALKHKDGLRQISQERKREELIKAALKLDNPRKLVSTFSAHKLWEIYGLPNEMIYYKDYFFNSVIGSEAQLLIQILWDLESKVEFKSWLKEFKCSTEVRQLVLRSLEFKENREAINNWSDEEMHFFSYKNDLRIVIDLIVSEMSGAFYDSNPHTKEIVKKIETLKKLMKFYSENIIKPVVNGDDLKSKFQGAELGRVLDLLFRKQLINKWTRSDQALGWLESNSGKG
jgi:poly(A) polymerase